ncbi:MAG TPA: hypothetical protein VFS60_17175 [Thermoanaerobaculia bacterium]|nr:hypothetical protein [Thermoanaerobaculia bacterium]
MTSTRRGRRAAAWFLLVLDSVLLLVWAGVPAAMLVLICSGQLHSLDVWLAMALTWAGGFLLLFFRLLKWFHSAAVYGLECMLGLICTLSLGLPAIFLGAMPLATTDSNLMLQHYSGNYHVDVPPRDPLMTDHGPRRFVIGIDVSRQFLGDPNVPGSDGGRGEQVAGVIRFLLSREGPIGASFNERDSLKIHLFTDGTREDPMVDMRGEGSVAILNRMARLTAEELRAWRQETALDLSQQDAVDYIATAASETECETRGYRRAAIVVFSDGLDFARVPAPAGKAPLRAVRETATSAEQSLPAPEADQEGPAGLAHDLEANPCPISLLAFAPRRAGLDAGSASAVFANQLAAAASNGRHRWQRIHLEDYHGAVVARDTAVLLGEPLALYSVGQPCAKLCLRLPYPGGAQVLESTVGVAALTEIAVGLHGKGRIGVKANAERKDFFSLALRDGAPKYSLWTRLAGTDFLALLVDHDVDIAKDESYLLSLAVPKASVFYGIALQPVENENRDLIHGLNLVFLALNCLPPILMLFIGKERWRQFRRQLLQLAGDQPTGAGGDSAGVPRSAAGELPSV